MKIAVGVTIQDRNIKIHTENDFIATYKGHKIYISTNHGFGKPKYDHLKRFVIDVTDKSGLYAVQTYQDCHTIKDAIRYALYGAMLI